jgi:TolB protein
MARTIAFARPGREGSAIFTVRMSGRHLTRLTPFDGSVEPTFSGPLGRRIAFTRFGATSKIWLMASDGTNERRLIDTPTGDRFPVFSPDGSWIAFDRSDQNRDERIYKVRSDGSDLRRVTRGKRTSGQPSFSPNGKSIVFDRLTGNGNFAIDVMRANGTHVHRVALGEDPAFSPNGKRLVFAREVRAREAIYTMDRRGHHLRRVTPRKWSATEPDWAPRAGNG